MLSIGCRIRKKKLELAESLPDLANFSHFCFMFFTFMSEFTMGLMEVSWCLLKVENTWDRLLVCRLNSIQKAPDWI